MARETDNAEVQGTAGGAQESPRGRGRVLSVAMLAVGLVLGGAVGWTLVGPALAQSRSAEATGHEGGDESHGGATRAMYTIENLIVNPAESRGLRFLVLSLAIESPATATVEVLASRDIELRDALVRHLGAKTVEELSDVRSREALKQELREVIASVVPDHEIGRIYLPLFVIQ